LTPLPSTSSQIHPVAGHDEIRLQSLRRRARRNSRERRRRQRDQQRQHDDKQPFPADSFLAHHCLSPRFAFPGKTKKPQHESNPAVMARFGRRKSGAVDPWLCVPDFRTGLPLFCARFFL